MKRISLCVASQTPPVRFKLSSEALAEKYGDLPKPVPIEILMEGEDFNYSPSGIVSMVMPLLKRMYERREIRRPHWVALSPLGPEAISIGRITLHGIKMRSADLSGYAHFKERCGEIYTVWGASGSPLNTLPITRRSIGCARRR